MLQMHKWCEREQLGLTVAMQAVRLSFSIRQTYQRQDIQACAGMVAASEMAVQNAGCVNLPDHAASTGNYKAAHMRSSCGCRVITPRCVWYTGHVTAGGSVCIEALTQSGSTGSWSPQYNVESMLMVVINNMLHCESYFVKVSMAWRWIWYEGVAAIA